MFRGLGEISAGLRSQLAGSVSRRVWGPWETTNREGRAKGVIKIHLNMQVQFLFLFLSWVVQREKTAKCEMASSRWEEAGGTGRGGWSLLLVVVAGTGGPTPDLTSELFYQLWILLLHLLGELLAGLDETGQVIL